MQKELNKLRLEFALSRDRRSTGAKSKSVTAAGRTRKDHVQEQGRRSIRKNTRRTIHRIDETGRNLASEPAPIATSGRVNARAAMRANAKGNRTRYRSRLDSV